MFAYQITSAHYYHDGGEISKSSFEKKSSKTTFPTGDKDKNYRPFAPF
jgi:hypothetical protein